MKVKKNNGLAGIDTIVAIIAVSIFSTLIFTLLFNNVRQNIKLKRDTLAMIHITEIFENIGIESYENITEANIINSLIPKDVKNNYGVEVSVTNYFPDIQNYEDIMKKVTVKLSYTIEDKQYTCSMERIKGKE